MKRPLISVVMPVYNGERFIKLAIDSILAQTYSDLELIIIDDGSKDDSAAIVKSFKDSRIRYYRQNNSGVAAARNKGLSKAKGEYVAMHDADDISLEDRLEKQVNFLETNKSVGLVGSNYQIINEAGQWVGSTNVFTHPDDLDLAIKLFNQFGQGTVMMRRSLLTGSSYDQAFKLGEDFEFWNTLAHKTRLANLKEELYQWRYHESSTWTGSQDEMRFYVNKVIDREFNKLKNGRVPNLFSFHPFSVNGFTAYLGKKNLVYRDLALLYARHGLRRKATAVILAAVLVAPWEKRSYKQLFITLIKKPMDKTTYEGI